MNQPTNLPLSLPTVMLFKNYFFTVLIFSRNSIYFKGIPQTWGILFALGPKSKQKIKSKNLIRFSWYGLVKDIRNYLHELFVKIFNFFLVVCLFPTDLGYQKWPSQNDEIWPKISNLAKIIKHQQKLIFFQILATDL